MDLLPVFSWLPREQITVNRYDPHPNELANTLAVKAIEPFIIEQTKTNSRGASAP